MAAKAKDPADEVLQRIAANVRFWRQEQDLTQSQLAELAGVEPLHIRSIEGCRVGPSLALIGRLSDVLEVDVMELFRPRDMPDQPLGRPPKE